MQLNIKIYSCEGCLANSLGSWYLEDLSFAPVIDAGILVGSFDIGKSN